MAENGDQQDVPTVPEISTPSDEPNDGPKAESEVESAVPKAEIKQYSREQLLGFQDTCTAFPPTLDLVTIPWFRDFDKRVTTPAPVEEEIALKPQWGRQGSMILGRTAGLGNMFRTTSIGSPPGPAAPIHSRLVDNGAMPADRGTDAVAIKGRNDRDATKTGWRPSLDHQYGRGEVDERGKPTERLSTSASAREPGKHRWGDRPAHDHPPAQHVPDAPGRATDADKEHGGTWRNAGGAAPVPRARWDDAMGAKRNNKDAIPEATGHGPDPWSEDSKAPTGRGPHGRERPTMSVADFEKERQEYRKLAEAGKGKPQAQNTYLSHTDAYVEVDMDDLMDDEQRARKHGAKPSNGAAPAPAAGMKLTFNQLAGIAAKPADIANAKSADAAAIPAQPMRVEDLERAMTATVIGTSAAKRGPPPGMTKPPVPGPPPGIPIPAPAAPAPGVPGDAQAGKALLGLFAQPKATQPNPASAAATAASAAAAAALQQPPASTAMPAASAAPASTAPTAAPAAPAPAPAHAAKQNLGLFSLSTFGSGALTTDLIAPSPAGGSGGGAGGIVVPADVKKAWGDVPQTAPQVSAFANAPPLPGLGAAGGSTLSTGLSGVPSLPGALGAPGPAASGRLPPGIMLGAGGQPAAGPTGPPPSLSGGGGPHGAGPNLLAMLGQAKQAARAQEAAAAAAGRANSGYPSGDQLSALLAGRQVQEPAPQPLQQQNPLQPHLLQLLQQGMGRRQQDTAQNVNDAMFAMQQRNAQQQQQQQQYQQQQQQFQQQQQQQFQQQQQQFQQQQLQQQLQQNQQRMAGMGSGQPNALAALFEQPGNLAALLQHQQQQQQQNQQQNQQQQLHEFQQRINAARQQNQVHPMMPAVPAVLAGLPPPPGIMPMVQQMGGFNGMGLAGQQGHTPTSDMARVLASLHGPPAQPARQQTAPSMSDLERLLAQQRY